MADVLSVLGSAGGVLSGIGSFAQGFSNLFGGDDYYRQAQDAFNKQKDLMKFNNEFQGSENVKSREFTEKMYKKQWQDYMDYNDYSAMVRRALDAGISPSALFQSGAPAQFGGLSPASVGHTASPSPSYEGIVNPVDRRAESFHSISSGLNALASASKLGVETSRLVPLMNAQIKNQLSESGLKDIQAKSADFEFGLRQIYGKKLYDSELGKNAAQMVNAYAQSYLFAEEGNTQESIRELNKAERLYKDILRDSTDKQIEQMNLQIQWYPKEMRARINNLNTESQKNVAQASEANASAGLKYSETRFQDMVNDIKASSKDDELDALLRRFDADGALSDQKRQEALNELIMLRNAYRALSNDERGAFSRVSSAVHHLRRLLGINTNVGVHN